MRVVLVLLVMCTVGIEPSAASTPADSWHLTTYYTAVASLHHGSPEAVIGCLVRECEDGSDDLGSYPADFVRAVHDEGTGRIDVGPHAGEFLEWSDGVGYWLDTEPLDSYGRELVPFVSAAAGRRVLPRGAKFTITDCGRQGGDRLDGRACARVRAAQWQVRDEFTPGLGGAKHVDLYVGEEQGDNFEDRSPLYFDVTRARLHRRV